MSSRAYANGTTAASSYTCTGIRYNQTCTYFDLVAFESLFYFVSPEESASLSLPVTYLHNRMIDFPSGRTVHSAFHPIVTNRAPRIDGVWTTPVILSAGAHFNYGHNTLDVLFGAYVALKRMAEKGAVPDPDNSSFLFVEYDDLIPMQMKHLMSEPYRDVHDTFGNAIVTLDDLKRATSGRAILVRSLTVGYGRVGLCAVDELNKVPGREYLRAFQQKMMKVYHITPTSNPTEVAFVRSKRQSTKTVENLQHLAKKHGAYLIAWEMLSLRDKVNITSRLRVLVQMVGTAQRNTFLVPAWSSAILIGRINMNARLYTSYYDSHLIGSLNDIHVYYYPSFSLDELLHGGRTVRLDERKFGILFSKAWKTAYTRPVKGDNSNKFDHAFTYMNKVTNGAVLNARSGIPGSIWPLSCFVNAVDEMLWGPTQHQCPWSRRLTNHTIHRFNL